MHTKYMMAFQPQPQPQYQPSMCAQLGPGTSVDRGAQVGMVASSSGTEELVLRYLASEPEAADLGGPLVPWLMQHVG
jgi:hypothetical protein